MNLTIRLIEPEDNAAIAKIIREVLESYGCVGPGYASSDPEIEDMYTAYQASDSRYWVVVDSQTQQVFGGGGFSRLKDTDVEDGVCELQKLYFLPAARGYGMGKKLLQMILAVAALTGYREMYLETIPDMTTAIALYEQFGFKRLPASRGNTGHHRCGVHMSTELPSSVLAV